MIFVYVRCNYELIPISEQLFAKLQTDLVSLLSRHLSRLKRLHKMFAYNRCQTCSQTAYFFKFFCGFFAVCCTRKRADKQAAVGLIFVQNIVYRFFDCSVD